MSKKKETKKLKVETKESMEKFEEEEVQEEEVQEDTKDLKFDDESFKEVTTKVPVPPPIPQAKSMLCSFDKWFMSRSKIKGWKPHWKNGLKAYADTSGRRSMEDWDLLFEKY